MGLLSSPLDDPREVGLLSLGLRLMSTPGSFGQALGRAGLGALNDYGAAESQARHREDFDLNRRLTEARIRETEAQAEQRAAQTRKTAALLENLSRWSNPNAAAGQANEEVLRATGNLNPTIANGRMHTQAAQRSNEANPLYGIPPQALQADLAFNEGKGIPDMIFKRGSPNIEFVSGVAVDKNRVGAGTSLPTINQSGQASQLIPDPTATGGYRVQAPAGSVATYRAFKEADADVASRNELIKLFNPKTQREEYVPKSFLLGSNPLAKVPPLDPMQHRVRPEVQASRNSESLGILRNELSTAGPSDRPAIQREIDRLTGSPAGAAAGPSVREKASAEAISLGNQSFMKDTYSSVLDEGRAADSVVVSVQTARNAVRNLGGTGWGVPTVAAVSSALAALGVPQAERVATNAQTFQQAAMTRLWETLNAAKGPQTEGDADRASKTFAQLQDTTRKNLYVLDLAQAQAERAQMRARFFREALPLAQAEGDLQRIGREWARIQPSVFEMPSMRQYK
jgi:hypothetical protein